MVRFGKPDVTTCLSLSSGIMLPPIENRGRADVVDLEMAGEFNSLGLLCVSFAARKGGNKLLTLPRILKGVSPPPSSLGDFRLREIVRGSCTPNFPRGIVNPWITWKDKSAYRVYQATMETYNTAYRNKPYNDLHCLS